jgi:hypothetical protein
MTHRTASAHGKAQGDAHSYLLPRPQLLSAPSQIEMEEEQINPLYREIAPMTRPNRG